MANWHALHFNKIAKMIREGRENAKRRHSRTAWEMMDRWTLEWVEYFKAENENFDEQKFIEACGYEEIKAKWAR